MYSRGVCGGPPTITPPPFSVAPKYWLRCSHSAQHRDLQSLGGCYRNHQAPHFLTHRGQNASPISANHGLASSTLTVPVTQHPVSWPGRCLRYLPRRGEPTVVLSFGKPKAGRRLGPVVKGAPLLRAEGGQAGTLRGAAGQSLLLLCPSLLPPPSPPPGSSNPGGCAPRAATSLAQSRAS